MNKETVAVLDFETTGLSPNWGDRATEIAITLVRDGQVIDRYQSLMNAGLRIPSEVTYITGITNAMIAAAPPVAKVMREACQFVGNTPMVAHNATFDKKFWEAELAHLSLSSVSKFACTMLLSRRIYPHAPNHRLSTLVQLLGLPQSGRAHRAMVDAEMTSHLWCRIQQDVSRTYSIATVNHDLLVRAQRVSRNKLPVLLQACANTR
ncbi:MAG: DNA polymerase III subunit epsilon [Comamonadaceae bacterium CG12_big_fil_rev_8_21_14_0_65_59_15]|nr:MAG: DNA polymerase III subunit epsilon [Comamonadaceae bacterium CG12_big_fil_rev_8_21_14_0_65_59_15]